MNFKNIPHVKQINDYSCGAACIEMLYKYYGINKSQQKIWYNIQGEHPFNNRIVGVQGKMAKELLSENFASTSFIAINDIIKFINECFFYDIDVILLHRYTDNDINAHYSIVVGIEKNYIYVNDSYLDKSIGERRKLHKTFITRLMKMKGVNGESLTVDNNIIAITKNANEVKKWNCPNCGKTIYILHRLFALSSGFNCPECEKGMIFNRPK